MGGWLTNGVPNLTLISGNEQAPFDTESASGVSPQSASISLAQLATANLWLNNFLSAGKTMVAGSRYYIQYNLGTPERLTGIRALVGGTGGTDKWIFELHDSTGALVATTDTSGTTTGTAGTWQAIDFTTPYNAVAGTYYIAVQSNGTTATLATHNAPSYPLATGSATGVFGTGASITPPTTYTADRGPFAMVY